MSAEVSFTKRAAAELSRCFNGISVRQSKKSSPSSAGPSGPSGQTTDKQQQKGIVNETTQLIVRNGKLTNNQQQSLTNSVTIIKNIGKTSSPSLSSPINSPKRHPHPPQAPPKTWRARRKNYLLKINKAKYIDELWFDNNFLIKFFKYFSPIEKCVLAQVCKSWKDLLYSNQNYWSSLTFVIYCNDIRREESLNCLRSPQNSNNWPFPSKDQIKSDLYSSIKQRSFDSICFHGATDEDIVDFASRVQPSVFKRITFGSLRCSSVSDKGLEIFLAALGESINKLELTGCNEISDSGLWTSMVPRLETLTILDCINIADETIAAICQMLPQLRVLQIQAYHVTDVSMSYFDSTCIRENLKVLSLQHCWELSNQGIVSLAHGLSNLTSLSLSGCSKITDDAIEVIAEQIRGLTRIDLSWCPRISDAALEYIACDLSDTLEQLILDRCLHITDIGLGYIATMNNLKLLSLRWCPQIRDFGLQTLCSIRTLKVLSLAGCPQLSVNGLSCLVQMQQLIELELTNCPGASKELIKYLRDHLPSTTTIIT